MADSDNRTLTDKFMLRLPDGMRERIKAAADQNNRSMNAEIVATLAEKFPEPVPDEQARDLIERFSALPVEAQQKFLHDFLDSIPANAIEDGLVPGLRLGKDGA